MDITLNDDEIRKILVEALQSKTIYSGMSGTFDPEECYFSVTCDKGEVVDLESVEFSAIVMQVFGDDK